MVLDIIKINIDRIVIPLYNRIREQEKESEVRKTLKYKDTYKIKVPFDSNGKKTLNKDDNYIVCQKAQIYRYNKNTLVIQFNRNNYADKKINELLLVGVQLKSFQFGDNEQTYMFNESDLDKVAEVCKAKRKVKRELTDEEREVLRQRMLSVRKMSEKMV